MVAFPGLIHVPPLGYRRGRAGHVLLLRVEMLLLFAEIGIVKNFIELTLLS